MKIAFIGYGNVGAPPADHLQQLGHEVTLAVADPNSASLKKLLSRNSALRTAPPMEAVRSAEVVFLPTPFRANAVTLESVAGGWKGQVLVDCTNPVGPNLTHPEYGPQLKECECAHQETYAEFLTVHFTHHLTVLQAGL